MKITIGRPHQPIYEERVVKPAPLKKRPLQNEEIGDEFIFNGIRIKGIRLESIESARFQVRIPLKAGHYNIPGPFDEADTKIPDDCFALATVKVGKDNEGRSKITEIQIELSEPAVIENPASAFQKPKGLWDKALNAISDHFAKIEISGARIDENGEIHLDGVLIKGGFHSTPLSEIEDLNLPQLNLTLAHLSEHLDPNEDEKSFGRPFLKVLGKIACEADYTFDAVIAPSQLEIDANDLQVKAHRHALKAHAQGKIQFNDNLEFSVKTDRKKSFVESVLGQIFLGISLDVEHPSQQSSHVDLKVEGILGDLAEVNVNNHTFSAKGAELFASAHANVVHTDECYVIRNGNGEIQLSARSPKLRMGEVNFHLDGNIGVRAGFSELETRGTKLGPSFRAEVGAYLQENTEFHTRSGKRHEIELSLKLHRSGRLSSSVKRELPSEVLGLPFKHAYRTINESDSFAVSLVQSLSKAEFRSLIEKATSSRIRSGNVLELLVDGLQSYPRRLDLIQNAKKSIWLQTLIFQDDTSGIETAKALAQAAQRGVRVCVIVDGQASAEDAIATTEENRAYQIMKEGGVELRLHNDRVVTGLCDILNVIVDNKLSPLSRQELVKGPVTNLVTAIAEVVLKLQQGRLTLPADQRAKLVSGLNKGLGRDDLSPIDRENPIFSTNSRQSINIAHLIERSQEIMQQVYSWHEKHLIVDGEIAILGGMNIADSYMFGGRLYRERDGRICKGWRDTDLLMKGPAVADQGAAFAKNWHHLCGERLEVVQIEPPHPEEIGSNEVQIIQHSPSIDGDNHITSFLVAQLNRLKEGESAFFENAYFCASSSLAILFDAMINAARRGVAVTILTNSEATSDVPTINTAAFHVYRDLLKAGVRIFERNDGRTIHSKIAVIGDELSIVGSANLDNRSARINSEIIAAVYGSSFAATLRKVILTDMDPHVSCEITLEHLRTVPLIRNAHSAAMSLIRDLC